MVRKEKVKMSARITIIPSILLIVLLSQLQLPTLMTFDTVHAFYPTNLHKYHNHHYHYHYHYDLSTAKVQNCWASRIIMTTIPTSTTTSITASTSTSTSTSTSNFFRQHYPFQKTNAKSSFQATSSSEKEKAKTSTTQNDNNERNSPKQACDDSCNINNTTLSPLEASLRKITMMSYVVSMCLALPISLTPIWILSKLSLITKRQTEIWAHDIAQTCARWLWIIMPFCNVQIVTPPNNINHNHDDDLKCNEKSSSSSSSSSETVEPTIWVCNHTSMLDTFVLLATDYYLRGPNKRPIKAIYWKGLENNPVIAFMFHLCGFIPVQMEANGSGVPNEYDRASFISLLRATKQAFQDGFDILILPEGQLNPWPELGLLPEVFSGAHKLSQMATTATTKTTTTKLASSSSSSSTTTGTQGKDDHNQNYPPQIQQQQQQQRRRSHQKQRPIQMVELHGFHKLWHADESIGMHVTARGGIVRAYTTFNNNHNNNVGGSNGGGGIYETTEEFIKTFRTVVGYFGANGVDHPNVEKWMDGTAWKELVALQQEQEKSQLQDQKQGQEQNHQSLLSPTTTTVFAKEAKETKNEKGYDELSVPDIFRMETITTRKRLSKNDLKRDMFPTFKEESQNNKEQFLGVPIITGLDFKHDDLLLVPPEDILHNGMTEFADLSNKVMMMQTSTTIAKQTQQRPPVGVHMCKPPLINNDFVVAPAMLTRGGGFQMNASPPAPFPDSSLPMSPPPPVEVVMVPKNGYPNTSTTTLERNKNNNFRGVEQAILDVLERESRYNPMDSTMSLLESSDKGFVYHGNYKSDNKGTAENVNGKDHFPVGVHMLRAPPTTTTLRP